MRLSLVCATCVAGSLSILALAVLAQQPGQQPPRPAAAAAPEPYTKVGVIDIAFIFKNHARFNGHMNDIKRDVEQYDAYMKTETNKFNTRKEELNQFRPGTPEYKAKEEELARIQTELQLQAKLKYKELKEREARVYFDAYKEIEQHVAVFAQKYNFHLILRFNGDDMKPDDQNSVIQGVNKAVVYQRNLDITGLILAEINRGVPNTGAPGPAAPGAGTVPPGVQTAPQRPIVPRPGTTVPR